VEKATLRLAIALTIAGAIGFVILVVVIYDALAK
jgi:preprotein translocase subunit Sss1